MPGTRYANDGGLCEHAAHHMKSIDRKLGTANRRDAVRRARELGLL